MVLMNLARTGARELVCVCVSHFTDVKDTDTDVTDLNDTLHVLSQRCKESCVIIS